ncbi:MAG: ATP-grasp domain-containing protein [Gemmataceae bacterium]
MMNTLKWITARGINLAYGGSQILRSYMADRASYKILFSARNDDLVWEQRVSKGFAFTRHQIAFEKFEQADPARYDLIVPLSLLAVEYIAAHPKWAPNNPLPTPSIECIGLCDNKLALNQKLIQKGHGDIIPRIGTDLPFPYVIKKSRDGFGVNTHLIRNRDDEAKYKHLLDDPGYFAQEAIEGFQEYAAHLVIRDGKLVCHMGMKHHLPTNTSITGMYSKVVSSHPTRSRFTDQFVAALNAIKFEGLCCIDYKIVNGKPKLFEINPRMGSSLCPFFFSFVPELMRKA